ncbi:hypothetical protein AKO1_005729 [Acrasis kona]|uniref:Uncharacterized protein n=1 Tax=Acrasis kona TaxID=1008807 RepID=A0AAW2YJK3_9EUKA
MSSLRGPQSPRLQPTKKASLPNLLLAPRSDNRFTGMSPTDQNLSPVSKEIFFAKKKPIQRNLVSGPSAENIHQDITVTDSMDVDQDNRTFEEIVNK